MKLLFCGQCTDIISPSRHDNEVRWCACRRHAIWWVHGETGHLRVYDAMKPNRKAGDQGVAWVIGLHNGLLTETWAHSVTTRAHIEKTLETADPDLLYTKLHSLVARVEPGYATDVEWSPLPEAQLITNPKLTPRSFIVAKAVYKQLIAKVSKKPV